MTVPPTSRHLVVYSDASMVAGAEESMAVLVEHLPEWVEVTLVGTEEHVLRPIADRRPGSKVAIAPPLATRSDFANARAVRRLLSDLRPSAVHLNKTEVGGLRYVECVTRTLRSTPVVSVVHHVEQPATTGARLLTRRLAAGDHSIVAVGQHLARQLEGILGLPAGRVHTIPNVLPPLPNPSRRGEGQFVVGSLARFVPHKAVHDLISAVAATESVHLIIGGDGPERERLERLVWRLGIAGRVDFLGWVESDRVLSNCDIVASASRIEGHPLTLLDARRRGLPIVATDVGGVPEIVRDGVNGLLIPPGHVTRLADAISLLSRDRGLRTRMGDAAKAAAALAEDPTTMAAAYCALYWPEFASSDRGVTCQA